MFINRVDTLMQLLDLTVIVIIKLITTKLLSSSEFECFSLTELEILFYN